MSQANPVNEGLIHAWLDGQLPPDDVAYVEQLVATDPEWGAAAAEARGLVAAASRALGALDDVPRVHEKTRELQGKTSASSRPPRAWWRSPWMRAAAGIVLVAGVSSVVWLRDGGGARSALLKIDDAPAQDAVAQTRIDSNGASAQSGAAPQAPRAPQGAPGAPPAVARELRETDAAGARERARAVAGEERKAAADTIGRRGLAVVDAAPPVARTAPVVDQGAVAANTGGGRGASGRGVVTGRGDSVGFGSGAGVRSEIGTANTLGLAAKALDTTAIDPRLAGCWAQVDTARQEVLARRDRADEQLALPALVRFVGAVATDVPAPPPASPVPTRTAVTQTAAAAARQAVPLATAEAAATRAVVNATVTRSPDSAFVAEWIDAGVRRIATFTARGDTLRGTLRLVPGDSTRTTPFVAVRAVCAR
jgi:hypothetical protein